MTISEFKAWLEGFTEGWGGGNAPTPEQWAKVLDKVATLQAIAHLPQLQAVPYAPTTCVTSGQIGGMGIDRFPGIQLNN